MEVIGWVDIGAIEAQVVRADCRVGSTRPIVAAGADIVQCTIEDVPGIREVVGSLTSLHSHRRHRDTSRVDA